MSVVTDTLSMLAICSWRSLYCCSCWFLAWMSDSSALAASSAWFFSFICEFNEKYQRPIATNSITGNAMTSHR